MLCPRIQYWGKKDIFPSPMKLTNSQKTERERLLFVANFVNKIGWYNREYLLKVEILQSTMWSVKASWAWGYQMWRRKGVTQAESSEEHLPTWVTGDLCALWSAQLLQDRGGLQLPTHPNCQACSGSLASFCQFYSNFTSKEYEAFIQISSFCNMHLKRIKEKSIAYIDFVLKYGTIENEIPRDILEDFDDKCILHAV